MTKYIVYKLITTELITTVEANSREEAQEIAEATAEYETGDVYDRFDIFEENLHPADGLPVCNRFVPMDEYDNASTCENCSAHIYDHLAHHRGDGIPLRPEKENN